MEKRRILEKIELLIPGFKGYKKKELRRESDKHLREKICDELKYIKKDFEYMEEGVKEMDELKHCEEIIQQIQKMIDKIEHADYGYAGFFDPIHIDEEELERLYKYDEKILKRIEEIKEREDPKNILKHLRVIEDEFEKREDIMTDVSEGDEKVNE